MRQLMQLKGIGINGAWLLVMEFFGWRAFKNRREVGGLAGFTPTPYQSGERARTRDHQIRQPACALDDHGVSVELAALSAGQRPECLVSGALRERGQAFATDWDCGGGSQVTHRALALPGTGVIPAGAVLKEG